MADALLSSQSGEALTDGTPNRSLSSMSAEVLTTAAATPERNLSSVSVESLTNAATIPERHLSSINIEVLVPVRLSFTGWGVPVSTPTWS